MTTKKTLVEKVTEDTLPIEGMEAVEELGTMYDPSNQSIDLSPEEKRRTTSLFLAINAYRELIIREADYLREAASLARNGDSPKLQPASIDAIVVAALQFDAFIAGQLRLATTDDGREQGNQSSSEV